MGKKEKGKKAVPEVHKWLGMELPVIKKERRNTLIMASVGTKVLISLITVYVFHSFLDTFGHFNSYSIVPNVLQGMVPWVNDTGQFYYPPLALVPVLIAYAGSLIGGFTSFVVVMWILMAACDVGTTLCVYYIGLKMYKEQTAFIAAMLNATAFSAAYFSFTTFDALPVFIAAFAVMATVYNNKTGGYLATVTGLFVKLWPIILYPFLWIYNSRGSSIIKEGKERAAGILLATVGIFGLMLLLGYNRFLFYVSDVYCNTIPYLVSQVLGAAVPFDMIMWAFRVLMVIVIVGALYWLSLQPGNITRMIKMILLAIFVLVFFLQYRSPQYSVWMLPFVALLVAGDIVGILTFYWVQLLAFIEFPLTFWVLWVNDHYVSKWAPVFFTVLFISYGVLLWRALRSKEGISNA